MRSILLWIVTSLLIVGCAARPSIPNIEVPYNLLMSVIKNTMPGGVRSSSANGRTLTSNYFDPKDLDEDAEEGAKTRGYAVVVVNGSSRPYNILVRAYRETKSGDEWKTKLDEDLGEKVTQRLKAAINDDRQNRNVIDDFRAF